MAKKNRTYADMKAKGRRPLMVWIKDDAAAALAALAASLGVSKTQVIEQLLTREHARAADWDEFDRLEGVPAKPLQVRKTTEMAAPIVEPGSPADLARRVLEKGRRGATVVANGVRVEDGRERRK